VSFHLVSKEVYMYTGCNHRIPSERCHLLLKGVDTKHHLLQIVFFDRSNSDVSVPPLQNLILHDRQIISIELPYALHAGHSCTKAITFAFLPWVEHLCVIQ